MIVRAGEAAHSSKPHLGKNALVAAAQLTKALYAEHESLQSRGGPLGPPTLTPTIADGGHGPNIVPQLATISCDYRVTTLPDNDTVSPQTSDFCSCSQLMTLTASMIDLSSQHRSRQLCACR